MPRARSLALAAIASACGAPAAPPLAAPAPAPASSSDVRYYTLWWNGARIGTAVEREDRAPGRVRLDRRERILVRRGDDLSATELGLTIDADAGLRATEIVLVERDGAVERTGRAVRARDGWRIALAGEPARTAPADAVPAELIPLLVRRDGAFAGPVLLPGRGFAVGDAEVTAEGPHRYRALLTVGDARLGATTDTDRDGAPLKVVDGDGVVAVRADEAEAAAPFAPTDILVAGSLPVRGADAVAASGPVALVVAPVDRELPPPLPGQRVGADGRGWRAVLDDRLPGALPPGRRAGALDEIEAIVREVDADIADDLGAAAPVDPLAAAAGDCTVHALAFAARADAAGVDTRIVTGFRLDGELLVRHRWAIAWTRGGWVSVDPAYGEAPAAPRLLGLAVHGTAAAELAMADAAYAGIAGAEAQVDR